MTVEERPFGIGNAKCTECKNAPIRYAIRSKRCDHWLCARCMGVLVESIDDVGNPGVPS